MSEQDTITIYHENLFPDIPNSYLETYNSQRQDGVNNGCFLYGSGSIIMPPRMDVFAAAWRDYILTPRSSFTVPRPEGFSDLQEVLANHDFRFRYIPTTTDRRFRPIRMSAGNPIFNHDVRYCVILSALNTILYLKNMIMYDTRLFSKIDMIIPWNQIMSNIEYYQDDYNQDRPEQYRAKKIFLSMSVYRELDELVRTDMRADFWQKIIEISNTIADRLIVCNEDIARRNGQRLTEYQTRLTTDNMEIKNEIIRLVGEEPLSEEALAIIYDLIVQANMQNCS